MIKINPEMRYVDIILKSINFRTRKKSYCLIIVKNICNNRFYFKYEMVNYEIHVNANVINELTVLTNWIRGGESAMLI